MSERVAVRGIHDGYARAAVPLRMPGGNARLYEIESDAGLLYKEFPTPLGGADTDRLRALADVGTMTREEAELSPDVYRIGWPLDVEIVRGRALGVVIRRAGEEFHRPDTGLMRIAQSFGHLMLDPVPAATVRLFVTYRLAGALRVLHGQRLVHGDVSSNNILWCRRPTPDLLLIDADSVYELGFPARPAHTPHWGDPRLAAKRIECHDQKSDWYALALAAYRAVVLDRKADPVRDLHAGRSWAAIPSPLDDLFRAAFGDPLDGRVRPKPKAWEAALRTVMASDSACASIDAAFASSTVRNLGTSTRRSRVRPTPARVYKVKPRLRTLPPRQPEASWGMRLVIAFIALSVFGLLAARLGLTV
jgi:DNA-binding helix-hairpin-helix protein with protein kinase domain